EILAAIQKILPALLSADETLAIENAALFHDIGKAHSVFQNAIKNCENVPDRSAIYAKSPNKSIKYERRYFRHELASALTWLMIKDDDSKTTNLSAYLIAAHHGKVRLSIRSMPDEKPPQGEMRIARGIQDGDLMPSISINGHQTPELKLDLSYMEIGFDQKRGESWISRMTRLRDEVGIFKLAYLEALVRAVDARASMNTNNQ
ncbi:MAG: CRISPR-associated endonuclease Cas3'', partial [Candidatus Sumerlaeia bacterium]|nr:CRISPR-associated endonuclease Cas3'' [Candidatus Sumerlaeia bacterium]